MDPDVEVKEYVHKIKRGKRIVRVWPISNGNYDLTFRAMATKCIFLLVSLYAMI